MDAKWETANPCEDQRGKQRSISRRQLLKSVGVGAAVTGLAYLSLTAGCSSLTCVATTDTLARQSPSTFTGETEDGVITEATAKLGQLDIVVKGKVAPNKFMPLLAAPMLSKSSTEKEKQQRATVEQILAASGSFVSPRDVDLRDYRTRGVIAVNFLFLGEKDPARRINLMVTAKDSAGNTLGKWSRNCEDPRIFAEKPGPISGGIEGKLVPENIDFFEVERSVVQNMKSIELTFRQSKK
ncbi:MAG: hypothetical protein NTX50_31240 [Candidatus Sumerlaeota bacterium]|nr:hypothetical protein [Candidatus Sumerlaeota bacterium]